MRRGLRAQKVLVASAARVAPGGESGPFQWLVPALVVMVVLLAALTVRDEAGRAGAATTAAASAQTFSAAAREARALQEAVSASHGANAAIKAQAKASFARMKSELASLTDASRGDPRVAAIAADVRKAGAGAGKSLEPMASAAD